MNVLYFTDGTILVTKGDVFMHSSDGRITLNFDSFDSSSGNWKDLENKVIDAWFLNTDLVWQRKEETNNIENVLN